MLREKDRNWVKEQARRYESTYQAGSYFAPISGGDRKRDSDLRKRVTRALEDMIWLIETWPPDQQNPVFTEEIIDQLTSALITRSERVKARKREKEDRDETAKREDRIAAMLMEKGAFKCLRAFERKEKESPLYRMVEREAYTTVHILKYVATSEQGVAGDYHFYPDRYKPEAAHAKRERRRDRRNSP